MRHVHHVEGGLVEELLGPYPRPQPALANSRSGVPAMDEKRQTDIVMVYIVMASILMACMTMAFMLMAYTVVAQIVTAGIAMASMAVSM